MTVNLTGFILRQEVLKLYRCFLRETRKAQKDLKGRENASGLITRKKIVAKDFTAPEIFYRPSLSGSRSNQRSLVELSGVQFVNTYERKIAMPLKFTGELICQVRQQFEQHREAAGAYEIKYLLSDGRGQLKALKGIIERAK